MKKFTVLFIIMAIIGGNRTPLFTQTVVNNIEELLPYLNDDNVDVVLKSGDYYVTADDVSNGRGRRHGKAPMVQHSRPLAQARICEIVQAALRICVVCLWWGSGQLRFGNAGAEACIFGQRPLRGGRARRTGEVDDHLRGGTTPAPSEGSWVSVFNTTR